jgi:large subunit ribosomal protein L22
MAKDKIIVRAYAKNVDQAPRKVAIVADLVRGRSVEDALVILAHTPRRAATPVKKAIESAKANATFNHNLDANGLILHTVSVTAGKRLKRFIPASRGRALPFQKKACNILIEVTGVEKVRPKAKAKTATKPAVKPAAKKKEENK